jgi:flagellar motor switch protein FliG
MIRTEHPQVIAIILSILDTNVAADVLVYLPPEVRPEAIQRVAAMDTVQPSAMAELEQIMKQQFAKSSSSKSSSFGGIKAAAAIMNKTKTDLERSVMDGLEEIDVELMLKIQDQMFTFDNLATVDNKGIQVLMRNVEPDQLMVALKGAPEEVLARFLDNMSERARGMFKDDMDARGPVRVADVEDAQKKIMRLARKLSDTGELILGGADFV